MNIAPDKCGIINNTTNATNRSLKSEAYFIFRIGLSLVWSHAIPLKKESS
jgi:hypothetical protein